MIEDIDYKAWLARFIIELAGELAIRSFGKADIRGFFSILSPALTTWA